MGTWLLNPLTALAVVILVGFLVYQWQRRVVAVSTNPDGDAEQPAAVMSNDEQVLLSTILFLWYVHARNETKRAERERNEDQNGRDMSANRRAAIKEMLDKERKELAPDKWMNKTQFRAIVGGNTTKTGDLFDELHRELDAVEVRQLNATLVSST